MTKEILVEGKVYPVKISYYALSRLQMETGLTPDDLATNMSVLEPLFYYSVEAGCKETGKVFDLKREDIPFILDDIYLDFIKLFTFFFPDTKEIDTKKKKS